MKIYSVWGHYTIGFTCLGNSAFYASSPEEAEEIAAARMGGTSKDRHGLPHRYEAELAPDYSQDTDLYLQEGALIENNHSRVWGYLWGFANGQVRNVGTGGIL